MNEFTTLMLTYMAIFFGLILLCFGVINFFMGGSFMPWLRVKTSRGKKILVRVRTIVQDYYKSGIIDKGMLVFKDREKEERRISVGDGMVYRGMGVNNIDVDDESNGVVKRSFEAVSGFDAVKYNYLYLRALFRPENMTKEIRIIIVLLVLVLIGVAASLWLGYNMSEQIAGLSNVPTASGGTLATGTV